ncbi:hypothetical protein Dimus_026577 [Dionaea muscipula]
MAGKRGRPRKAQALQRGSIVSQRGTGGSIEKARDGKEKMEGGNLADSRDLREQLTEVDLEVLGKVVDCGDESEALTTDLAGKTVRLQTQSLSELNGGQKEGAGCNASGEGQVREWRAKEVQGLQNVGVGAQENAPVQGGHIVGSTSGKGIELEGESEAQWQTVRGSGRRKRQISVLSRGMGVYGSQKRGKAATNEKTLISKEEVAGYNSRGSTNLEKLLTDGDLEESRNSGRWGDESEIPVADREREAPLLQSQTLNEQMSEGKKQGVYLAVVQRGLVETEGPRQDGPRSMVGNRDRQNGMPLSYEEHVGEEL